MEDPLYREIILDLWENPQNYGVLDAPDLDVRGNNPLCGDQIRLTGKVVDGRLAELTFTGEGCAISRASASLFTERVRGMTLQEIRATGEDEVLEELGMTLTPARRKCALLVYRTLVASQ
jgi:nitrogen fixation protein NifU and related proteins